jgi:hypothetical protein
MDGKYIRIWKELIVVYFSLLLLHLFGDGGKSPKHGNETEFCMWYLLEINVER